MRYLDAKMLHNGDEVTVKRTGAVETVVEIEVVEEIHGVSVRLSDGNWYGYKELQ